ncbi:hypothetical protein ACOJBO_27930 [Rhizobium beringeri]
MIWAFSSSVVMAEMVADDSPVKSDISVCASAPWRRSTDSTSTLFLCLTSSVLDLVSMNAALSPCLLHLWFPLHLQPMFRKEIKLAVQC